MSGGTDTRLAEYDEFVYELRRKSLRHTSASMSAYDFTCACELCGALPTIRAMADELARVSREAEQAKAEVSRLDKMSAEYSTLLRDTEAALRREIEKRYVDPSRHDIDAEIAAAIARAALDAAGDGQPEKLGGWCDTHGGYRGRRCAGRQYDGRDCAAGDGHKDREASSVKASGDGRGGGADAQEAAGAPAALPTAAADAGRTASPATPELSEALKDVPVAFGLRAQGHLPTIEAMLREGCTWTEIGRAIRWDPDTAREWYGRESATPDPEQTRTMTTERAGELRR